MSSGRVFEQQVHQWRTLQNELTNAVNFSLALKELKDLTVQKVDR